MYIGNNLRELSGPNGPTRGKVLDSAEECQIYCQKFKDCLVFTYFNEKKTCFIKSSEGELQSANAISGPRYCSGNLYCS